MRRLERVSNPGKGIGLMKLEPADIFSSAASGVITRAALAWLAVWLGLAMATMELGSVGAFLLLPATVLFYVLWGGALALLTFPVLCYTAYRALRFVVRGEGDWAELGILALLSAAVCLPVAKVSLPHFVFGGIALAWLASKFRSPAEEEAEQT
jgi:hypothetical protein